MKSDEKYVHLAEEDSIEDIEVELGGENKGRPFVFILPSHKLSEYVESAEVCGKEPYCSQCNYCEQKVKESALYANLLSVAHDQGFDRLSLKLNVDSARDNIFIEARFCR